MPGSFTCAHRLLGVQTDASDHMRSCCCRFAGTLWQCKGAQACQGHGTRAKRPAVPQKSSEDSKALKVWQGLVNDDEPWVKAVYRMRGELRSD